MTLNTQLEHKLEVKFGQGGWKFVHPLNEKHKGYNYISMET